MPALKATERHQKIMDQLSLTGRIDVSELAEALGVSTVTIRADLLFLEKNQILRRIRGGAITVRLSRYERPVDFEATLRNAEKIAIAALAVGMIRDGETIIMDTGSTVAALASLFPRDLKDIAVVTNSLPVAQELLDNEGTTIILTGGKLRPMLKSMVAPFGDLILKELNADVAFMSCAGVDPDKGFTNGNWEEAEIKKAMIRAANRVVFLADHTKLGHIATARIAMFDQVDVLITDSNTSADMLRDLRATGLEVLVA